MPWTERSASAFRLGGPVGTARCLLWDYSDWNPDKREKLPQRRLIYFVVNEVPARGSRTFDLKLRVSPNQDWKHLLTPYREHFQQTFGPVRYKADYRWIATDYLNHSQQAVSRDQSLRLPRRCPAVRPARRGSRPSATR